MAKIYSYAFFVDLPNFYSRLLKSGVEESNLLRDYFLYWLDFDRLSEKLAGIISPTWVFYSGRRFGPSGYRIQDDLLNNYIKRINSLRGVTARDVNIPGNQREPASYNCDKCHHEGIAEWESEKGIDASLTVHLFDTMDTWDIAFLLSGDADFVPAVASLRRRGKIVVGAGFSDVSPALVRECYDYLELLQSFLVDDVIAYMLFKRDGIIYKWLTEPILPGSDSQKVSVAWKLVEAQPHSSGTEGEYISVILQTSGGIDLASRIELLGALNCRFPDCIKEFPVQGNNSKCELRIHPRSWKGIERRLDILTSMENLDGPVDYSGGYIAYEMKC